MVLNILQESLGELVKFPGNLSRDGMEPVNLYYQGKMDDNAAPSGTTLREASKARCFCCHTLAITVHSARMPFLKYPLSSLPSFFFSVATFIMQPLPCLKCSHPPTYMHSFSPFPALLLSLALNTTQKTMFYLLFDFSSTFPH